MKAQTAKEKLLDASLSLIREVGFSATTVDALCARAGVTKGAFFHYFKSKDALGVAAADHWSAVTSNVFKHAAYHAPDDPAERLFAYVAFRRALVRGAFHEFTCVAGTMLQEVYGSAPNIQSACAACILEHAATLEGDCAAALEAAGRTTPTAASLARYTQTVVQGAFIMAKASGNPATAVAAFDHLERYLRLLLGRDEPMETTA